MRNNQIDPYLYPDTPVLRNKLGIKDSELLAAAEVDMACKAIHSITMFPIEGNYDFSHYCEFHKRIFGEIYDWAGEPRTVLIEKHEAALGYMSIEYASPNNIKSEAEAILQKMKLENWEALNPDSLATAVSKYMASLWKVHPFRDGNTRTTITFICQYFESIGIHMDKVLFEQNAGYMRTALVAASAVYNDIDLSKTEYLLKIVDDSIKRGMSAHKDNPPPTQAPTQVCPHPKPLSQKNLDDKPSVLEAIRGNDEQLKVAYGPKKSKVSGKAKSKRNDER